MSRACIVFHYFAVFFGQYVRFLHVTGSILDNLVRTNTSMILGHKIKGHEIVGHKIGEHKIVGHKLEGHKIGEHRIVGHKLQGNKIVKNKIVGQVDPK